MGPTAVEQLSGLDAAFVHQDSVRTPMHVTAVLFYDAGETGLTLPGIRQLVEQRLRGEPLLQRELQRVPLDMDTPYWVPARKVDWRYHLSEHRLSPGADWNELQTVLQGTHSRRMDLKRPLWQLKLVDGVDQFPGMPEHCQVLLLKAHHAAVDGISLAHILHRLHDSDPPSDTTAGDRGVRPNHWDIWSRANINNLGRQKKFAETMSRLLPGLMRLQQTRREGDDIPPASRSPARFNDRVGVSRSVGLLLIPEQDFRQIKRKVRRVTFNDIASSIIAGALRQYLERRGELPARSLMAGMPIDLRARTGAVAGSNQIATMSVGLRTDVADPVARLRALHASVVAGKRNISALGTGTIMDISDSLPPTVMAEGLRTLALASRVARVPVPFHTMISNVPGPDGEQSLDGARLIACAGLGPVRDNMGLFHIVSSTTTHFSIAFNACRKLLPDADQYLTDLELNFRDLLTAAAAL